MIKKLLLAAFFLFSASFSHALNLSEIRTQVRIAIRDNPADTSRYRYSNTVLNDLINEGQRQVVNLTHLSQETTSYILTAGVTYYNLPPDLTVVQQVIFYGTNQSNIYQLEQKSLRSLFDKNPTWERIPGSPNSYLITESSRTAQTSAPLRISYFPVPTRLSTGAVVIWYSSIMDDLSADSDVPFENRSNIYPHHQTLVYYAIMRIKLREGKVDEMNAYGALFADSISIMRTRLGEMPDYTPGIAIPGVNR